MVNKKLKYFLIIFVIFFTDLILKTLLLTKHPEAITKNTGIGLGILQNNPGIAIFISIVVIAIFFILLLQKKQLTEYYNIENFAIAIIIGGSLSNLFDRIVHGFVIDYINIMIIPVFNISDFSITIGIITIIILLLRA